MRIDPETLKKLRKARGLSQEMLADVSRVSKKTIARIETGKGGETRGGTAKELAKALSVKIEVLTGEPGTAHGNMAEESSDFLAGEGVSSRILGTAFYRHRITLSGEALLAYDLVREHYRVDMLSLVHAAPLLFTLLAEMSLADRRRRADEVNAALEGKFPEHLAPLNLHHLWDELVFISWRDIFARNVGDPEYNEMFDDCYRNEEYFEERRNPFSDFLGRLAKDMGPQNDAIDPEKIHFDVEGSGFLHKFSLFNKFREKLTGGSSRADCALDGGYARIRNIPRELMPPRRADEEDEAAAARVKWLEERIPDEDWEEYQTHRLVKIEF